MGEGARQWRKSSRSGGGCDNCVDVATGDAHAFVRDSKDPDGPHLAFAIDRWREFLDAVKTGEFDRPPTG